MSGREDSDVDASVRSVRRAVPEASAEGRQEAARRAALSLVADLAVANRERRARGLAEGTLRREFGAEVRSLWERYERQVGPELARGTTYFQDALNTLLAGGQRIF